MPLPLLLFGLPPNVISYVFTTEPTGAVAPDAQLSHMQALHNKPGIFCQGNSILRNTRPTAAQVADIGLYFPFVNRESQLEILRDCLQDTLAWYSTEQTYDQAKGFQFTLCHGISGLGKTTLACEGIRAMLDKVFISSTPPCYLLVGVNSTLHQKTCFG